MKRHAVVDKKTEKIGSVPCSGEGCPFCPDPFPLLPLPNKEALDATLQRGLEKALEIRKKVEGYERAGEKTQHIRLK